MKKLILSVFAAAAIAALSTTCSESPEIPSPDIPQVAAADGPGETPPEVPVGAAADTIPPATPKCIYLTIDDSPLHGSPRIDSVVSAGKTKANLFVVGNHVAGSGTFRKHYKTLRENPYVEIYNHSYSHAGNRYANYYKDPGAVLDDFEKNRTDCGIEHKIARLPGRNLWQLGAKTKNYSQSGADSAALLSENGYRVFGWDVEWEYDHKSCAPKQSVDRLVGQIDSLYSSSRTFAANRVVLLVHDQMFAKADAAQDLGELISRLKDGGYTFEHLTSYPD